jgi:long-subunit acyl-CoA synthetase (AMP-forming)
MCICCDVLLSTHHNLHRLHILHCRECKIAGDLQTLLERYGMTEVGMALSNPYDGARMPGTVGQALPGVEVDVRSAQDSDLAASEEQSAPASSSGELLVRGDNLFSGYWQRPQATAEAFDARGFFSTGTSQSAALLHYS